MKRFLASLPMRERELKQLLEVLYRVEDRSLPMRERELKLRYVSASRNRRRSLPMRERELKHNAPKEMAAVWGRSPCGSVN